MEREMIKQYKEWLQLTLQKDELTDQDIENILDGQLELPAEEMDNSLIEECLLYLYPDYEKGDMPGEKESRKRLKQHMKEVRKGKFNVHDNMASARPSQRIRPAIVILLVLLGVLLLGTAISYAIGHPIWNYVFHWGDEQLRIDIEIHASEDSPVLPEAYTHFGLNKGDAFDEMLKELQMDPRLPAIPEDFALVAMDSSTSANTKQVVAVYEAQGKQLHVYVDMSGKEDGSFEKIIEKDGKVNETIVINGTSYSFYENMDTIEVVWLSPPYMIQVGGNLTKDELKSLLGITDGGISK